MTSESSQSIDNLHKSALDQGLDSYIDPPTGFNVFTSSFLERRGKCCGSGCRHCPYAHRNVSANQQNKLEKDPYVIDWEDSKNRDEINKTDAPADMEDLSNTNLNENIYVLFWSGGKDSLLTYYTLRKRLQKEADEHKGVSSRIMLLSTYNGLTEIVAHQEVSLDLIRRQAKALNCPLVAVPLYAGREYVDRLSLAFNAVKRRFRTEIKALVFGDLHLDHIRQWRESALEATGIPLEFPIWHCPYESLLDTLFHDVVKDLDIKSIKVSAVPEDSPAFGIVRVGDDYSPSLVAKIRDWNSSNTHQNPIDIMGENGDFHSAVEFANNEVQL